jgi:hypothetical protein
MTSGSPAGSRTPSNDSGAITEIWEELKNRTVAQFVRFAHGTIRIMESTVRMHLLAVAAT